MGFYFITLQSARGGPATTGGMTITLSSNDDNAPGTPEGTFTSFFDIFFDVRFGSANGPIALSSDLQLSNSGAVWDANPSPNDFLVLGLKGDVNANWHTNKIQNSDIHDMDFFPVGNITESAGSDTHVVIADPTPEPGTMALIGGALLAISRLRRRS